MMVPPLSERPVTDENTRSVSAASRRRVSTRCADGGPIIAPRSKRAAPRVPGPRRGCTSSRSIGGCASPTWSSSPVRFSPCTSTGSPKAGGPRGARGPPWGPRRPQPGLCPPTPRRPRAKPRCRAATTSAPTTS
ncbi:hypothetical protein HMPREF1980_02282 [Actinomyces sp. oral taxon 172 str. F0311]|nr:hypothetical protein HMPREF1980_02282 [Actinomyces sp. oral taxon 172 str. F0311]